MKAEKEEGEEGTCHETGSDSPAISGCGLKSTLQFADVPAKHHLGNA